MARLALLCLLLSAHALPAQRLTLRQRFGGDNTQFFTSALTSDARTYVTVYGEYTLVRLWDPATGKPRLDIKQRGIRALDISPDDKILAGGGSGRDIHLWALPGGKEVRRLKGHTAEVQDLRFYAGGKRLASCGADGRLILWDVAGGKAEHVITGAGSLNALAVSPDGSLVVTCHQYGATVFDTATGKAVTGLEAGGLASERPATVAAFSPDGRTLAVGYHTCKLHLWEVATWGRRGVSPATSMMIHAASFSACGRTVATSAAYEPRLWDLPTNTARAVGTSRFGNIARIHWGPGDRSMFVATWGMTAERHDCDPDKDRPAFKPTKAEDAWADLGGKDGEKAYRAMWSLALSADGVKLLCERMADAPAVARERSAGVAKLLETLESDDEATRGRATEGLARLGAEARPAMEKALGTASPEAKRRLRRLLDALPPADTKAISPAELHALRAVEALGCARTPAARETLLKLAKGADTRLAREAKAAAGRMPR